MLSGIYKKYNGKLLSLDDVRIRNISTSSNTTTFKLKRALDSTRYTAFIILCHQSTALVGMYAIGVNASTETITKIAGVDASISRNDDNVTVIFSTDYIYSTGIVMTPRYYS